MRKIALILASCAVGIMILYAIGCGGKKVEDSELALAARNVVDNYALELKDALYTAIEDSGVVWAVRICSEKAPEIAARYSSMPGWTVKRVSEKYRNPADAPDDFEKEALGILESRPANAGDEYYRWVDESGQRSFRFMKAIKVKATCLNCHGPRDRFDPELVKILDEKYPDDQAYDFAIDDYRGAFSVKIDWPEGKAAFDSMTTSM